MALPEEHACHLKLVWPNRLLAFVLVTHEYSYLRSELGSSTLHSTQVKYLYSGKVISTKYNFYFNHEVVHKNEYKYFLSTSSISTPENLSMELLIFH